MSEPQNEGADQSPEPTNEAPSVDLSPIQTALMQEFDKRFAGFQSILDKRTSEFQRELAELKTADMSPEEREQFAASEAQREVDALKRENELLKMRREFAEEVDLLETFFEKGSLREQLELLSQFRKAQAEVEAPGVEVEEQPTPVDKNSPPRRSQVSLAELAREMDGDLADKLLGSSNEKGFLKKLRGG